MEAAPVSSEDEFNRYTPQHPLPEEIKKLARDDTVCKYCGVSYLIHNEIKALEEKLKEAEKELAILRGQKDREQVLKKENESLNMQKEELKTTIESNTALISSLNNEIEKLKVEEKLNHESSSRYKKKYMDTLCQLSKLSQVVRQQKETLEHMKQELFGYKEELCSSFVTALANVTDIQKASAKEIGELESRLQCTDMEKMVLSQSNKSLTDQLKVKEEELKLKLVELQSSLSSKEKLEQYMLDAMTMQKDLEKTRNLLNESEVTLKESKTQCNTLTVELDQYKMQMRHKITEVNDIKNHEKQIKQEHEVAMQKMTRELQSKEGELATCLRSLKKLEDKFRDQQQKENQIALERNSSINELQELKESLERARGDREALKAERELLIQAHQNRIEDLRESFKKKMAEMDNWPQKLQAAVAAEKTKHHAEMKDLEENLKHNFILELQIEKDKYNELLKKFQAQEKDRENLRDNKVNQIEKKYSQEMDDLKRQIVDIKRRATEREDELTAEISNFKKIINDLQDRFAKLDGEDTEKVNKLQFDLSKTQQELSDVQERVDILEDKLKQSKEKAEFLQGIVQKECEERFELTEALSDARKELLRLKMPPDGYNQKRGSVGSQSALKPEDEALLKSRTQLPPNNINISYSNKNNSNNSSRNSSGEISSRTSNDSQILESRKRIAHMLGRRS